MKSRHNHKVDTPIMSMIDVVFLLIIFFVVTSAIDREAVDSSIQLAKSEHADSMADLREIVVNIRRNGDQSYSYSVAGTQLGLAELPGILAAAVERHGTSFPVVIRASADAQYQKVDEVTAIVGRSGLRRVSLATQDVGAR